MTHESVTIILPVPDKRLSPNARCHWKSKMGIVKRARYCATNCAIFAMGMGLSKRWKRASILVRWFGAHHSCLLLDQTNIIGCLKAYEDGLVDAALLANDRGVTWLPPERAVDKLNPRVELVVTRTESP